MALPSFTTQRLIVRQLGAGDIDAVAAMDADPEVTRYTGGVETGQEHRAELAGWVDDEDDPFGMGMWVLARRESPERCLGWVMLWPLDGSEDEIEIGWRLARDAWGKGYATEAAAAVMEHGFGTVGLDHIVAVLDPANQRSRRVCEKLGMTDAGMRRAYDFDCALYVKQGPG